MRLKKNEENSNENLKNDGVKWMLIPVKIILRGICMWPENQSKPEKFLGLLFIILYVLLDAGVVIYSRNNSHNWSAIIISVAGLTSSIQVFVKYITLILYNSQIRDLLSVIRNDFWPSILSNAEIQHRIDKDGKLVKMIIVGLLISTSTTVPVLTFNLVTGQRSYPIQIEFWFNWSKSPVFELFYVWQWFMVFVVCFFMNGFDLLFFILIKIYISQIWIVSSVLSDVRNSTEKFRQYFVLEASDSNQDLVILKVIIKCVEQHNVLIQMYSTIKTVFSLLIFVQFLSCLIGATLTCVTVTMIPDEKLKAVLVITMMLFPLFLYCWMGSQLQSEGLMLSDAAYKSNWEQFSNKEFQKGILLIIKRSQQALIFTGAGLMQLNLQNFLKVLKFSVSVYTLMQSLMYKKK